MAQGTKSSDQLIDILKQIQLRKTVKPEDATKALQQYHKVQEHIKTLRKEIELFRQNKEKENQAQTKQQNGNLSSKSSITSKGRLSGLKQPSPVSKFPLSNQNTPRVLNGPVEKPVEGRRKESIPNKSTNQKVKDQESPVKAPTKPTSKETTKTDYKTTAKEDTDKELARLRFQNAQLRVTLEKRGMSINDILEGDTPKAHFVLPKDFPSPEKLSEEFKRIYEMEWRSAFHDLDKHYKLTENTITELLGMIAKEAYNFCLTSEKQQFEDIKTSHSHVTDVLVQPKYATQTRDTIMARSKSIIDKYGFQVTRRYLRDYRKAMSRVSIPGLTEIFENVVQRDVICRQTVLRITPKSIRPYIHRLIEINWLMVLHDPPMAQAWPRGGQLMNREWFTVYSKKGATVIHTVWPAVFIHKEGTLAERGVVSVK